jgi:predicted permease
MQPDFLTTLINVGMMTALAIPGFLLKKKDMLPEKAVAALVAVLVFVSQPFITISGFMEKKYEPTLLANMGIALLFSLVFHVIVYFVARTVFFAITKRANGDADDETKEKARMDAWQNKACTVASFMGNAGFMGLPVMKALFPNNPEMLIYTAVINIGFNIASWTLGVYTITGNKKDMGLKRALCNPPTLALVVGLPLFFFNAYIPVEVFTPVSTAVNYLADMTLPLSMIILGIRFADLKIKELFTSAKVYLVCFLKLIVSPLICFALMFVTRLIFPALDAYVIIAVFVIMAMPTAALTLSFAEMYDGDRLTVVKSTVLSTFLSIVTIPLLMLLTVFL